MTAYRAPIAGALRVVPLDDLVAVFHRPSGQTHLVVAPVPEILDALDDTWVDAPALLARLAERFDLPDADAAALTARLDELAEAGVIERA